MPAPPLDGDPRQLLEELEALQRMRIWHALLDRLRLNHERETRVLDNPTRDGLSSLRDQDVWTLLGIRIGVKMLNTTITDIERDLRKQAGR